jgi:hypothetical protein
VVGKSDRGSNLRATSLEISAKGSSKKPPTLVFPEKLMGPLRALNMPGTDLQTTLPKKEHVEEIVSCKLFFSRN